MGTIIFIGFSLVLALIIIERKHDLFVFWFPILLLEDHLLFKGKKLSKKILILISVLIKILIFLSVFTNPSFRQVGVMELTLSVGIVTILVEWVVFLIAKAGIVSVDKYFVTKDGLFLFLSSLWVVIVTNNFSSKILISINVLLILSNLGVSIKAMINLCIKREDYLKQEFGEITAANQLAAIVILIVTQIVNYTMLVYLLIHSNNNYNLLHGCDEKITSMHDVLYYVIITYTTVGYGDITPSGTLAQIVASMISFTSFFMSVVVIGIILSFSMSKVVQNNRKHNS